MKRLFDSVTERIKGFVSQRDSLGLVIASPEHESAYILKILQSEEETDLSGMYWSFADHFQGARQYVDLIVAGFKGKFDGVRELQEKEGEPVWPALPAEITDPKHAPADRLRALMVFSRGLLPKEEGHVVVWVLFPLKIGSAEEYAGLMENLLRFEMPRPWCHHIRVILRDEKFLPALKGLPAKVGRVQEYAPDMSTAAMEKSLEEETADEVGPLPERLQNTFILANLDYSHGRFNEALAKYKILLKYYVVTKNPVFTALVLNGMGEVYNRMEKPKEAKEHLERALTPAIESDSHPVLLNITLNLGNLHSKHKSWEEAEIYFDSAAKFAKGMLMAETRIQSLDNLGYCQWQLGRSKEAVETWNDAADLAKGMEVKDLLKQVLQHKQALFKASGHTEQERAVTRELQAIT